MKSYGYRVWLVKCLARVEISVCEILVFETYKAQHMTPHSCLAFERHVDSVPCAGRRPSVNFLGERVRGLMQVTGIWALSPDAIRAIRSTKVYGRTGSAHSLCSVLRGDAQYLLRGTQEFNTSHQEKSTEHDDLQIH